MRRPSFRPGLLAGLALAATPVAGAPLEAGSGCGGNAYSSAQVVEGRPARHGPLVAVPDTLCADLAGPRPSVNIDIYGVPGLGTAESAESGGIGARAPAAPYGQEPRRGTRPLLPRSRND